MVDDHDDDSVGSGNEFLEGEKRRDPIEFAQKYMAQLEKLMNSGALAPGREGAFGIGGGSPPGPPPPVEFQLAVTQIANGWLVSGNGNSYRIGPHSGAQTQYVKDRADVFMTVAQLLSTALGPDPAVSDFRTPPPGGK